MVNLHIRIITEGKELPDMICHNYFHSSELFHIIEKTPRQIPYMVIAQDDEAKVHAHLLAIIRYRASLFPPYLYAQGRCYGEGEYLQDIDREQVFALMLKAITRKLKHKLCFYIEFSDISHKMFGYRFFRKNRYFPVPWQEVKNSLHSKKPEDRISPKMTRRIEKAYLAGVTTREVENEDEVHAFYQMLSGFYRMKMRRLIPPENQMLEFYQSNNVKIFITKYRDKVIGGCVCVYSEGNAYLWYLASKRKSFSHLHPNILTVWNAIQDAYKHNYAHIFFLDVGLPYRANPFREFILSFGGKPVAKYRWFRFTIGWINHFLSWWFKE